MDNTNWRNGQAPMILSQADAGEQSSLPGSGIAPSMESDDWRALLPPDSRLRIVNKIMDTLKKHLPFSGQEGLQELKKIAVRFEEKIYSAATSQSDYLRKISLKMLTMENKSQSPTGNSLQANAANASRDASDLASHSMQSQMQNQGLTIPIVGGQSQGRQQLLSQNIQNNIPTAGMQNSATLTATLPSVSNLSQASIGNAVGQSNLQSMQNNPAQNPVGNSIGQGMPSNVFANSQRQMQGRPQQVVQQQQQQQQNPQHLYQQQLQQQFIKQKLQSGAIAQPMIQSHVQNQHQQQPPQQQNLLQPGQIQTSQHTVMQPSMMQSGSIPSLQQNQQSPVMQTSQQMLQQHQPVVRQHQQQLQQVPSLRPQQTSMAQQPMLQAPQQVPQQQPPLIGQTSNATSIQQSMGQQNSIPDLKQKQHRLIGQIDGVAHLQQQQLVGQQNNLLNIHHPQLGGPLGGVSGLQQPAILGTQSVAGSGIQSNQHPVHMLPHKVPVQQQMQQNMSLAQNQTQHSQPQPQAPQHQMMSPIQSQTGQMQNLQQQPNSLQRDMQQRVPASTALLQQQNMAEHQKQLFQSQRAMPEASSMSVDSTAQTGNDGGGDWQEEVYQKIKSMKEMYFPELNDMYVKIATKLQQHDALPQPPKNEQFGKLKMFKSMLERLVQFLQLNKNDVQILHKDRLGLAEKQIISILNTNRPRKTVPPQQGPLSQPYVSGMQHSQPQSQMSQLNTLLSAPSISNAHQNQSLQPASNSELAQNGSLNSQNSLGGPQTVNLGSLSSQTGMNTLQSNLNSLQTGSSMLQNQHLRQQEHHMLHNQQLKQIHQRQQQQQFLQRQQQQQQQQQQQIKPQLPAQLPPHALSPLHMTDSGELKMRQQPAVKSEVFQQHPSTNQWLTYSQQQLRSRSPFSSSQVPQTASPQIPQQPSPQIDQQNPASLTKSGTPLHSANSPFVVPSPSTPLAPSPIPGDSEKVNSGISSVPNSNIRHLHTTNATGSAQSLAIGTPGISASPLLAEFTSLDGAHGNTTTAISGRPNTIEQPIDRLIKVVKSASHRVLSAAVSDISSVVSMIDITAGSAPGNGSRAAVGEDLVAMTKCRLQARNSFAQDGSTLTKKLKRSTSAMPSNVVSFTGSVNDTAGQLAGLDAFELESTATSCFRRRMVEANQALVDEIHELNRRLIDTVVDISDEDADSIAVAAAAECGEGTIVKCSFTAVALSPNLKSQDASAQMSPIQPLRLLIPGNYPNCSPIVLDKFPVEVSKEYEDLSMKAMSRFSISLRSLSQPMSLGEMAMAWDNCVHAVISEYVQQSGGGSFSSKYGMWENCITAS